MAKPKKLPLLKIMDHECFKRLSETQKIFVMRHIACDGKNALDAVKFAYPKVQPKNLMSFKCQVLRSPKVQRTLNLWLGRSEMDVLAAKLEPLLDIAIQRDKKRKRISTSTERAISLIASHAKSKAKAEGSATEDDDGIEMVPLDRLIERPDGKRYRVTLVEVSK